MFPAAYATLYALTVFLLRRSTTYPYPPLSSRVCPFSHSVHIASCIHLPPREARSFFTCIWALIFFRPSPEIVRASVSVFFFPQVYMTYCHSWPFPADASVLRFFIGIRLSALSLYVSRAGCREVQPSSHERPMGAPSSCDTRVL